MGAALQSIGSVAAGFAVMVAIVMAGEILIAVKLRAKRATADRPSTAYLVLNLAAGTLAALAGGAVVSLLAPSMPMAHVAGLAGVVVAMGLVSALMAGGAQPRWYQAVLALGMPLVVLVGGWLRMAVA
jgi:hypothetical protein